MSEDPTAKLETSYALWKKQKLEASELHRIQQEQREELADQPIEHEAQAASSEDSQITK